MPVTGRTKMLRRHCEERSNEVQERLRPRTEHFARNDGIGYVPMLLRRNEAENAPR
jgi:hypothetical protein